MAASGALAVLVALSTVTSAATPAGRQVEPALHLPKLSIHAPATVPAAASPQFGRDGLAKQAPVDDVDITGPVN
ncbi:hypothetical protein ACMDCR_31545 [Labrys okinawensis]|uniref:hypothetical protein n=1 Tax=Labrys okinawensis TaxID=346911 RepID=UPI0039BC95DE